MSIKDLLENSKKAKKAAQNKKTAKNIAIGAGIGVAAGAAAGLLFAPKAGKDTRKDIAKGAKKVAEATKEKVSEAKEKVHEAKEKVTEIIHKKDADATSKAPIVTNTEDAKDADKKEEPAKTAKAEPKDK